MLLFSQSAKICHNTKKETLVLDDFQVLSKADPALAQTGSDSVGQMKTGNAKQNKVK